MRKLLLLVITILVLLGGIAMADIRTETYYIEAENERIEGVLCLPAEESSSYPTVILAHGFGANYHFLNEKIARELAKNGFAAYAFNFRNPDTRSMLNTSVLMEAATLNRVIDGISKLDFVDKLFLLGESQGGFVASYVAASRPDDISALILYYPAFVLQDDARKRNPGYQDEGYVYPEVEDIMGNQISGMYSRDALSFEIYDVIPKYTGEVLLIHGTADPVVPLSYSERAVEVYEHARLITIPGAGHGFYGGSDFEIAVDETVNFLKEQLEVSGHD